MKSKKALILNNQEIHIKKPPNSYVWWGRWDSNPSSLYCFNYSLCNGFLQLNDTV